MIYLFSVSDRQKNQSKIWCVTISEIFIAMLLGLQSLSREVMANTAKGKVKKQHSCCRKIFQSLQPSHFQTCKLQSCKHCYHLPMFLIPECHEQDQGITFPSEKIDSAQKSKKVPELLEVLDAPMKQQNGTLCWVDLSSHPPWKQQNCPSLFHG